MSSLAAVSTSITLMLHHDHRMLPPLQQTLQLPSLPALSHEQLQRCWRRKCVRRCWGQLARLLVRACLRTRPGLPPHPSWPSCLCGIAMAGHKCSKLCAAVIVSGNDTMHQHMAVQTS